MVYGKKGMMDDLFDLLFTAVAMFFCVFFIHLVLAGNIDAKNEATLTNLNNFNSERLLLHFLDSPVYLEGSQIRMKDLILLAVNTDNEELFEQNVQHYLEQNKLKAKVEVYMTPEFLAGGGNLFEYGTLEFSSSEAQFVWTKLPNLWHKISSITVVLSPEEKM